MRVAFVVNTSPPRVGGVENHVSSLARHLAAHGHYVLVFTATGDRTLPAESSEDGVHIVRVRERLRIGDVLGFPALGTSRRLRKLLRRRRIDVVSVHTRFFPLTWIGNFAAHQRGIPVVHTEHGSDHVASDSWLITYASRLVDWTLGRWSLRSADAVLGVSENVLDFVTRLSGRNGTLFYNAIEPPAPRPADAPDRPGHLVFVGRLVPGKGWDTFLDVVDGLRARGRAVTAEVLGDGPDMLALRTRLNGSPNASAVAVRGRVDPESVRAALRGATLVNPTVLSEGFQTTLLEAIAEGGRVATFPVAGTQILADAGAPIAVSGERTAAALESVLDGLLAHPPAPAEPGWIDVWTWPNRATQFIAACRGLTHIQ